MTGTTTRTRTLVVLSVVALLLLVLGWQLIGSRTESGSSSSDSSSGGPDGATGDQQSGDGSDDDSGDGDDDSSEEDSSEEDSSEEDEPTEAATVAGAAPAGEGRLPDASAVTCPRATTTVASAEQLETALEQARAGDSIELEPGTYEGEFTATARGTADAPVFLCGPTDAVLDGGATDGGYVVHLDGAAYWRLVGFTVTNGQKGVMADATSHTVLQGLTVEGIGDEAIHLRDQSTDNVVRDNTVRDTGLRKEKFGEGVYVGTAVSNWCSVSDCEADRSDRNVIVGNDIAGTTSEAVDLKEGTTGGVLSGNSFDGSSITEADSWVDVKGNNWLIAENAGTAAPEDGFQTHQILDGWGDHNVFTRNRGEVNASGNAISSQPPESNVVTCDNRLSDAGEGLSNIECS